MAPDPSANSSDAVPETFVFRGASVSQARLLAAAALLFGLLFSFSYVARGWLATPWLTLLPLPIAAGLASIGPVRRTVARLVDGTNAVGRRRPVAGFLVMTSGAAALLVGVALLQGRAFEMLWHDEFSYLVQTRIAQAGRLWMPPHPLGDFFDTFHFVQRPVYGAMYPPGTALVFAPLMAVGLPAWGAALLLTSVALGLLYVVIARLLDPAGGLLAVFIAVALHPVRLVSLMLLSQPVILLMGLLMIWATVRWIDAVRLRRRRQAHGWMALLGASTGMAALTRPLDALCLAGPILVLVLWELSGEIARGRAGNAPSASHGSAPPPQDGVGIGRAGRFALMALVLGLVSTAPFLAVQFWMNARTTGKPLTSLYSVYHEQHYPELMPGFHDYALGPPRFDLPQKQAFFESYTQPFLLRHTPEQGLRDWFDPGEALRASQFFGAMTPGDLVAALLPLGLLFLRVRRRVAVVASIVPFCIGYTLYAVFMRHYAVAVLPAILLPIVAAVREGPRMLPAGRSRAWMAAFGFLLVIVACILQWPPIYPQGDEGFDPEEMIRLREGIEQIDRQTAAAGERAIILFRFNPEGGSAHLEPVYNIEAAWPDEARVIRAHDLGSRNSELFDYYALRQPDRVVYLYDRAGHQIRRLGPVSELVDGRQAPLMADDAQPGA